MKKQTSLKNGNLSYSELSLIKTNLGLDETGNEKIRV